MLLQFTVENFKSFRNKTILSLEGSSDKNLEGNYSFVGKEKLLKSAVVFGANASGKSNIFLALTAAILAVRQSNQRQINDTLDYIVPFKFDPEAMKAPSSFEFVFIGHDGKKYVYGFSATNARVVREYLYAYNSSKATTIFERENDEYQFTSPERKREMLPITERNTQNKLFLATATQWNCSSTKEPYLWLDNGINTYSPDFNQLLNQSAPYFEADHDHSLKDFTVNILHEADINIDDYEFESKELNRLPHEIRSLASTVPFANKEVRVETVHTIQGNGTEQPYGLSLWEESQGTRNLFLFAPFLKRAFENGETICIDEFDMSIHPILVEYLIGLFHNPSINKMNAQLIISTHAVSLLSLSILRRDQIYFVEKDRATGVSEMYSLDEFSPRKQENIRKAYLLGRYGSIPNISMEADLWG